MSDRDITIERGCSCGNNDPSNFWILRNTQNDDIWGVCCKKRSCQKEYLVDRFAHENEERVMIVNEVLLYANKPIACELNPHFQVRLSRERVNSLTDVEPGDHVGFDRSYILWHHAIVVEVNAHNLVIEGWAGMMKPRRVREIIEESELTHLYKFKYSGVIEQQNPPELVLARSKSRLHGDGEDAGLTRLWVLEEYGEHYGLFNANCEHYSTYCKTGQSSCNQTSYLWAKLKEAFSVVIGKCWEKMLLDYFKTEVIENVAQELVATVGIHSFLFEMIGMLGIVWIEGISFRRAIQDLRTKRQNEEIDKEQYREELGKRVIEFLLVVVVTGGGGIIIAACYSPVVEIILSLILVIAAKIGARSITHFMSEEDLKWYAEKWEQIEKRVINLKNDIVTEAQKAVNFVHTEVLPAICSAIEATRDFFAWLI